MKKLKGSFTVEGAVLVPFLILVIMTIIYFMIYVYDKTLMTQDVNGIIAMIRDENELAGKSVNEVLNSEFLIIKDEHPYMALDNLELSFKESGANTKTITLTGEFKVPVWSTFNTSISYSRDINSFNPVGTMYTTENIKGLLGGLNADSDDV